MPATPITRVAAIAAAMLAEEGQYTVKGRYYASAADAAKARIIEAERDVRIEEGAARRQSLLATRYALTDAGRAVVAQARRERQLRDALELLVDDRDCDVDVHGICRVHEECCSHSIAGWECPVSHARTLLAGRVREMAS
jgi:hypothetical protein